MILDSDQKDAAAMVEALRSARIPFHHEHVRSKNDFRKQLRDFSPDLILAEYSARGINGLMELKILREQGLELPFIFVTAQMKEEIIVECIKAGATDFVLKPRLTRLAHAVRNTIREKNRLSRKRSSSVKNRANEERLRLFSALTIEGIVIHEKGIIVDANQAFAVMFGYELQELIGKSVLDLAAPESRDVVLEKIRTGYEKPYEAVGLRINNTTFIAELRGTAIEYQGRPARVTTLRDITDRKRIERALQEAHDQIESLVNSIDGIVWEADAATLAFTFVSKQAEPILGYPIHHWYQPTFWQDHLHLDDRESAVEFCKNSTKEMRSHEFEYRFIANDGIIVWIRDIVTVIIENGAPVKLRGVMVDITERKRAEEDVKRMNRALRLVSEVNQTLVRATTEKSLLDDACRIIVELGGYRMASVGYAMAGSSQLQRRAEFGVDHGYFASASPAADAMDLSLEPERVAASSGNVCIARLSDSESIFPDWRAAAIKSNVASTIALPFLLDGKVAGVLNIYSSDGNAFNPDEVRLLEELANDLAFGIQSLRTEADRKQAEQNLLLSEERYRSLAEAANDLIFILNRDGRVEYINQFGAKQLEHAKEEIIGKTIAEIFPLQISSRQQRNIRSVFQSGEPLYVEADVVFIDNTVWLGTWLVPLKDGDGAVQRLLGISRDITKRVMAESSLRASEERYRTLFENMVEGLCLHEIVYDEAGLAIDYRITDINPAYHRILGITREQAIGKLASELYGASEPPYLDLYARVAASGEPDYFETYFPPMDKHFAISVFSPVRGKFATIFLDISERVKSKEKLEANEAYTRSILENEPECVKVLDRNGKLLEMNAAGLAMIEAESASAVIGLSVYPMIVEEHLDSFRAMIEDVFCGKNCILQFEMIGLKGTRRWMESHAAPLRDHDGNIIALLGITRDVTEQKHAVEKIRTLSRATDQSPALIIMTDPQGAIDYVNPKFTSVTGYSLEEVLGKNPRILKSGETSGDEYAQLWKAISAGGEWRGELHNRKKNGELYWTQASISPIFNEAGIITHYLSVSEDITERKRTDAELIAAKEAAEQSNKLKDAFIANISHEIRTPMNIILGYADVIQQLYAERATVDEQLYFENIHNGGERLLRTVDLILNVSRAQVGDIKLTIKTFDLVQLIEKLIKEFADLAEKKSIGLQFENRLGSFYVEADEYCLSQALVNLIDNAIKYTLKGGITIQLRASNDVPCLDIIDTGIGIAQDYLPHMFQPYSQEDVGYTRMYQGIGLGLTLVEKYLSLHNLPIAVTSAKGYGTTFTIQLENIVHHTEQQGVFGINTSATQRSDQLPLFNTISTKRPLVLVVEDDDQTQIYMKAILRSTCDVLITDAIEPAWEFIQSREIDLILLDISLQGGKNGLQLVKEIRASEKHSQIPIIAVTAHAFPIDKQRSLDAGCNAYIAKPMSQTKLFQMIDEVLHRAG